ncbi:MAG: GNAT family N-acetyltransferase [Patescibacteria group bacterium]
MNIKITKKGSKKLEAFHKKEWASEDVKHYGKPIPWDRWQKKDFTLEVCEDKEIIGSLTFTINADVAYIDIFLVADGKRSQGIGRVLIAKAEKLAREHGVHKIYLQTGKDWESVTFYVSQGYKKTADLPNHYFHTDFVEMTKFL